MTRLPNKRGKKVFFLRFAEEGFPCGEDDIQIEEVENLQTTIFKPGFNWFTSLEKATKARNEIIESIRPIPYLRGEAMSEIRKDFDRAYQERYGIKPDETHAALWAAKWMAERCAQVAYDDELDFKDAQIESLQSDRTDQELLIAQLQARVEAYERALEAIACKEPYHNLDGYCCRAAKVLRTHKGESR